VAGRWAPLLAAPSATRNVPATARADAGFAHRGGDRRRQSFPRSARAAWRARGRAGAATRGAAPGRALGAGRPPRPGHACAKPTLAAVI